MNKFSIKISIFFNLFFLFCWADGLGNFKGHYVQLKSAMQDEALVLFNPFKNEAEPVTGSCGDISSITDLKTFSLASCTEDDILNIAKKTL